MPPMLSRCSVEDVYRDAKSRWERLGYGVVVQGYRHMFLAWADGTWIIAQGTQELEAMMDGQPARRSQAQYPRVHVDATATLSATSSICQSAR